MIEYNGRITDGISKKDPEKGAVPQFNNLAQGCKSDYAASKSTHDVCILHITLLPMLLIVLPAYLC